MRAVSSLSRNLDMRALGCVLLMISSSFIAFHDSQKAAKSLQNRPKVAFLKKHACAFHYLLACTFNSKRVQNLDALFFFNKDMKMALFEASPRLPRRSDGQAQ